MWPWEHLVFGYLLYSGYCHFVARRPPRTRETVVVAFATQFPDLVDKPLAWTLFVLPAGRSLAHSLLVAMPLIATVSLLSWRLGVAFGIGYLSHLAGDLFYRVLIGKSLAPEFLLWPLTDVPTGRVEGALPHITELFADFVELLMSTGGRGYLLFEGGFLLVGFLVWVADGMPGIPGVGAAPASR